MTARIYHFGKSVVTLRGQAERTRRRRFTPDENVSLKREYEKARQSFRVIPETWWKALGEKYDAHVLTLKRKLSGRQEEVVPPKPATNRPEPSSGDPNSPIAQAKQTLHGRWHEAKGSYWLDGQPIRTHDLIRAANIVRQKRGGKLIVGCDQWVP